MATFRLTDEQADRVRALARLVDDADELEAYVDAHCPETAQYVRSLYSSPYTSGMWHRTVVLHAIDVVLGGDGVEPLGPVSTSGPPWEYVNFGDPFATTVLYSKSADALYIGAWGPIAEKHPSW
jgi:hypothetical protein